MLAANLELAHTVQQIIEFIGTFAFAISGIRMAAAKHFDWFGGFVCGFAVAIGGGTIRDVMLGAIPFWMTSTIYIICTIIAMLVVIVFAKSLIRWENAWLTFDTFGLASSPLQDCKKPCNTITRFGWPSSWAASLELPAASSAMCCSTKSPSFFKKTSTPWPV